jgi:hypothetical protein
MCGTVEKHKSSIFYKSFYGYYKKDINSNQWYYYSKTSRISYMEIFHISAECYPVLAKVGGLADGWLCKISKQWDI